MTTIANLVGSNEKVLAPFVDTYLASINTLLTSDLAVRSPAVDAAASGGPRKVSVPFLNPLAATTVNMSTDVLTDEGAVQNLTADEYTALRLDMNRGFASTDLTQMVTKFNTKGGIAAGLADYWNTIVTNKAVSMIKGALKNTGLTYTSTAGESIYSAAINAAATANLYADKFDILIVPPTHYAKMRIDEKNAFVPASQTGSRFDTWAGFKLIKSTAFGTDLVVARSGALAYGEGTPAGLIPLEVERKANGGNGGGADILHSRKSVVIHPQGFTYVGPTVPTDPQLETVGNWTKKLSDEMIGFRKIVLTA